MNALEVGVNVLAVVFGLVWVWISVYLYYPLVRTIVKRTFRGLSPSRVWSRIRYARTGELARNELTDGSGYPSDHQLEFDVLLPAYEESEVIENSIASVREAAYDQAKINLIVLTEPDDEKTNATLRRLKEEYEFTQLCVPEWYPGNQNKPRALNYGFDHTNGDVVTVIDAENVFHSSLFRRVNEELLTTNVDFLQARLDMVNEDDGWLNTLFRAEYGYWYQVVFPPFFEADYPIPIGGTSCVFRRSVLEEISERRRERYGDPWTDEERQRVCDEGLDGLVPWNPDNVTEDFELGLFLWQNGFESGYIHEPNTDEESPLTLDSWVGQRTRWQKGKVYTLLDYLKHPPDTFREKAHLYTQTGIPHLGLINIIAVFVLLLGANLAKYDWFPLAWVLLLSGLVLTFLTLLLYGVGYWRSSTHPLPTRVRRTLIIVSTVPVYWVLHWIADVRAFVRTYRGEFHWVKTAHAGRNVVSQSATDAKDNILENSDKFTFERKYRVLALTGILAIALSLRLHNISGWSLHGDELYTLVIRANLPPKQLVFIPADTHPPLHYLLLHYWIDVFGNSVKSVRMLSVIASVATVGAVYLLGTSLYDDRAGLAAAFVTALSVYQIHHGQNARMYSFLALFTAASWYGFTRLRANENKGQFVYGVSTVLLLYTHLFACFIILAQNIYLLITERQGHIVWRGWIKLQAIVGLFAYPVLWFYLSKLVGSTEGPQAMEFIGWLQPPTLYELFGTFLRFIGMAHHYPLTVGMSFSHWIAAGMMFVYAILAFTAVVRYRSDGEYEFTNVNAAGQMFVLIFLPIAVPVVLSYLWLPMFFYRYVIGSSIGLYVLVGKGIANLDRRWLTGAVVVLVVLASGGMLVDHYTNRSQEPIEGAVQCLEAETDSDDAIIVQTFWEEDSFGQLLTEVNDTPLRYFDLFSERRTVLVPPPSQLNQTHLRQADNITSTRDTVWVLQYALGGDLTEYRASLLPTVNDTHSGTTVFTSPAIRVSRFTNTTSTDRPDANATRERQSISKECTRAFQSINASSSTGDLINSF